MDQINHSIKINNPIFFEINPQKKRTDKREGYFLILPYGKLGSK